MPDKKKGALHIDDSVVMPPLDPLKCDQAIEQYARGVEELSPGEKFSLGMHIADGRGHEPRCPAHDPKLLEHLKEVLGTNNLLVS